MIDLFSKGKRSFYRKKKLKILFLLTRQLWIVFLLACSTIYADATTFKSSLWSQILASHPFSTNSKFLYLLEGQLRLDAQGKTLDTTVIRLGLGYQLTKRAQLFAGYTGFPTTNEQGDWIIGEQRCWQQLNLIIRPSQRLYTTSSTRLEQRFIKNESGTGLRLREKIKVFWQNPQEGNLTPVVSDEVFLNLNHPDWVTKELISQNRFFIGLAIPLNNNRQLNLGYMNVYQFSSPDNINRNVLFISLSI